MMRVKVIKKKRKTAVTVKPVWSLWFLMFFAIICFIFRRRD